MTASKAIGGIRVSTDMQADKYGPVRQRTDIQKEADRSGLFITQWVEEAISGADDERAAENQYYDLARRHPGLHVIFSHPNRVGRHVEVTVGIARRIHKLGGTVWIAGLGNLRDRRNWKEFLRDAVDAESEYSNLIYNLDTGKFNKAQENKWPEGKPPYGYRLIREENGRSTTLELHPQQAPIFERARDLALAGSGAYSIANEFNRQQVPEPRQGGARKSKGWSDVQVRRMLLNPRYMGYADYRGPDGRSTRITFPALVTPGQHQQLVQGFQARRTHRRPVSRYPSLFGGHLVCAHCGASLTINASRDRQGNRRWAYYICRTRQDRQTQAARGLPGCPDGPFLRVESLDEQCWAAFSEAVGSTDFMAQALAAPTPRIDHSTRLEEIDQEMADIITQSVRFSLPDSAVQASLKPLREERQKLQAAMHTEPLYDPKQAAQYAAAYAQRVQQAQTLEERRALLALWQVRAIIDAQGVQEIRVTIARN